MIENFILKLIMQLIKSLDCSGQSSNKTVILIFFVLLNGLNIGIKFLQKPKMQIINPFMYQFIIIKS